MYFEALRPECQLVDSKLRELKSLDLPIDIICPSHGACWRKDIHKIIDAYALWANGYREDRITIAYDSMWGATRAMAEAIAKGIREADSEVVLAVHSLAKSDKNDVMTDIFRSKAFLLGSPSHNKCALASVGALLEELRGLSFQGKKAAAFGSYGWSGEGQVRLNSILKEIGYECVDAGIRNMWQPSDADLARCVEYGRKFALKVQ